jgi:hypothetical protein
MPPLNQYVRRQKKSEKAKNARRKRAVSVKSRVLAALPHTLQGAPKARGLLLRLSAAGVAKWT